MDQEVGVSTVEQKNDQNMNGTYNAVNRQGKSNCLNCQKQQEMVKKR